MICTDLDDSVPGSQGCGINELQREYEFLTVSQVLVPLLNWQSSSQGQKFVCYFSYHTMGRDVD